MLDALEALRGIPRRLDSPYVFPGEKPGKPFYDLTRCFEKAVAAAKLEGVAGVDLTTVKEIMRHKSITMTVKYAHLSPGHRKAAVDALANALRPEEKKPDQEAKTA